MNRDRDTCQERGQRERESRDNLGSSALSSTLWWLTPRLGRQETYLHYGMPEGLSRTMDPWVALPLGAIAGMTACTVAFPFQTAWKRLQTQGVGGRPVQYSGMLDVWSSIIKKEGMRGMYAGWPANLIKLAPTGAITFLAVEQVKYFAGYSLAS